MSKRKLKEKFGFKIHSVKQKLFLKEKELEATLKAFDEIRDELSYYKGFHDGVKNGAKVNFSPTINQPQKKEFPSGGVTEAKPHNEDREFCKMRPRPETIKKVLNFSKDYEKNAAESWGEIFESFANSDAKGLVICKGAPSEDIIDILKSHFDEKNKEDLSVNNEENIKIVSSDEILKNDKNLDEQN